jgi:hypothetical protein
MSIFLGIGRMKDPGPGFFPTFVGLLGIIFGAFLLLNYLRRRKTSTLTKSGMFEKGGLKRFLGMIIAFCAWLIFMPWLGFIIMTFFASLAFAKIMGLEGWFKPILLAVGGSVFIYLLFDVLFYADLPRGILG